MRRTIALASLLLLLATACGETKDTGFPPPPPPTVEDEHSEEEEGGPIEGAIDIGDSFYEPKTGTVAPGTTVRWEQSGAEPHSVTFDDGSFDSSPDCPPVDKCTLAGDEVSYDFTASGVYPYYCKIHGGPGGRGMAGVITVE